MITLQQRDYYKLRMCAGITRLCKSLQFALSNLASRANFGQVCFFFLLCLGTVVFAPVLVSR